MILLDEGDLSPLAGTEIRIDSQLTDSNASILNDLPRHWKRSTRSVIITGREIPTGA